MRRFVVFASAVGLLAGLLVATPSASAAAEARATDDSCPAGEVPSAGFGDVPESDVHGPSIDCVVWWELATGTSPTTYAPTRGVTREQMATFVLRLVTVLGVEPLDDLPDAFDDDNGSTHEASIDQLAARGIVTGVGNRRYNPSGIVTRDQMATFLVRAYELAYAAPLPAGDDAFPDDDGNTHEPNIDKAAAAGFTGGRADGTYNPSGQVLRNQMASFLARVLDLGVEQGLATTPGGGGTGSELVDAATGGTVTSTDGNLTVDIPPGALDEDTVITIEEVPEDELRPEVAADPNLVRPVYDLGPDGTTFSSPVTVTRRVDAADLDLEPGAVPVIALINGADEDDGGEWLTEQTVVVEGDEVVVTGATNHFSKVYAFSGGIIVSLDPSAVETIVGDTWVTEPVLEYTTPQDHSVSAVFEDRATTGVVGTVDVAPGDTEFICDAAGRGTYAETYDLRERAEQNLPFSSLTTPPPTIVSLTGDAVCRDSEPSPVDLSAAAVCTDHGSYQAGDTSYPSKLTWVFVLEFTGDGASAGDATLVVDGMNDGNPLVFPVALQPGGGQTTVTVDGGIRSYGQKSIVSFLAEFGSNAPVDMTEALKLEVGDAPEVTASDGQIGGSATCPTPD